MALKKKKIVLKTITGGFVFIYVKLKKKTQKMKQLLELWLELQHKHCISNRTKVLNSSAHKQIISV